MQEAIRYPDTRQAMLEHLRLRLNGVVPDFELKYQAELAVEINQLKREKKAIILGHNYMEPALYHSIPDYTGDSLQLSRIAAQAEADIIVFAGVRFMAETAKILNPKRLVLLPSEKGGCSLAASITREDVRGLKARYPGIPVVSYVNTYADVKAESDYCCTSGNATEVVRYLQKQGHHRIIFLPDEYLARNVAQETEMAFVCAADPIQDDLRQNVAAAPGRKIMIGWRGRCEVHEKFTVEDIDRVRQQFPDVVILAHPECSPEVIKASDFSGSTTAMIQYVEQMPSGRCLLLTECSMADNITAQNSSREMIRLCNARCPHMNEITLEETLESLRQERYVIEVAEEIRLQALKSLDRMISIG